MQPALPCFRLPSISSNESVTLKNPSKDEYHFAGWYDNPDFNGNKITVLSNVNSNITLYANWSQYDYYLDHWVFDGTADKVINTGIKLYNTENVNRNFRLSFTIDDYDSSYDDVSNSNQQTIFNCKNEAVSSVWPGIMLRLGKSGGSTVYQFGIRDSHITTSYNHYQLEKGIKVSIIREDGKIYVNWNDIKYSQLYAYNDEIDTFDVPLTFGGIINSLGEYDRIFKGEFSQDNFEGEGTMIYKDKSEMKGIYKNSLPVGTHIKTYSDGKVEEIKFTDL